MKENPMSLESFDGRFSPKRTASLSMTMDIPIPPSVNHIFKWGKKSVYRSKNYRDWIKSCEGIYSVINLFVQPPVAIELVIYGGSGWRINRDLDNVLKPTIDLMRFLKVIPEDNISIVNEVIARYIHPAKPRMKARAVVTVRSLGSTPVQSFQP